MTATKRVRVFASGRVQGVGFRYVTAQRARAMGVGGFVRNLPDGRVEAAFEGEDEAVDALVEFVRGGPGWSTVEEVEVVSEAPAGVEAFDVRP